MGQSGLGVRYFKVFAGGGTRGGAGDYADATVRFFEGILHVLDVEISRVSQLGQKVVYVKARFDKIFFYDFAVFDERYGSAVENLRIAMLLRAI